MQRCNCSNSLHLPFILFEKVRILLEICNWPNKANIFDEFNYDIKILYIDSGCDVEHDEIKGNVLIDESISFVEGDKSLNDYTGHGTQIISAVVGKKHINGLYNKSKVVVYKITNSKGVSKFEWLYDALLHAIEKDYKVINISYSGVSNSDRLTEKFQKLVDKAKKANIHICCSASNERFNSNETIIPASLKGVYSIGSLDFQNKISLFNKHTIANYYAPGGDDIFQAENMKSYILLANSALSNFNIGSEIGLDKRYTLNFGNSIACSYFSCCVALIIAMLDKEHIACASKSFLDELYKKSGNTNILLRTREILLNGIV